MSRYHTIYFLAQYFNIAITRFIAHSIDMYYLHTIVHRVMLHRY